TRQTRGMGGDCVARRFGRWEAGSSRCWPRTFGPAAIASAASATARFGMPTQRSAIPRIARRRVCWATGAFAKDSRCWAVQAGDLARAFPQAKIVLDHMGGPVGIGAYAGKHKEIFPGWAASIKSLAACPNVYVKLGGLGMRLGGFGFHELP